jgi:hypothetical protein
MVAAEVVVVRSAGGKKLALNTKMLWLRELGLMSK